VGRFWNRGYPPKASTQAIMGAVVSGGGFVVYGRLTTDASWGELLLIVSFPAIAGGILFGWWMSRFWGDGEIDAAALRARALDPINVLLLGVGIGTAVLVGMADSPAASVAGSIAMGVVAVVLLRRLLDEDSRD